MYLRLATLQMSTGHVESTEVGQLVKDFPRLLRSCLCRSKITQSERISASEGKRWHASSLDRKYEENEKQLVNEQNEMQQ